jgi:putative endonuclease
MSAEGTTIYILLCADGSYYTGLTRKDLGERVGEHNNGTFPGFTSKRRPVQLVYASQFDRITDAIATERRIKGWSRAKKEALIRGDHDALQRLAARRSHSSTSKPGSSSFETRASLAPQDEEP